MTVLASIYILSALSLLLSRKWRILTISGAALAAASFLAAFALGISAEYISAGLSGLLCCLVPQLLRNGDSGK